MEATIIVMALAALAAVLIVTHFRAAFVKAAIADNPAIAEGVDPPASDLVLRADRTRHSRSSAQLLTFSQSIIKPASLCGTLVEEIRPAKRTLRQSVSRSINIPATPENKDDYFFVPIMTVPKGELQDNLNVTLADGSAAAVLNYSEYLTLAVHTLRVFFVLAIIDESVSWRIPALEENAVTLIAQRGRDLQNPEECISEILALVNKAQQPRYLWLIAELVKALAMHYPVVAVVPRPENARLRTIVRYERLVVPRLRSVSFRTNWHRYLRDKVGRLVGTRPIELDLTLENASYTQSYHVQIFGPEGTYLGFQEVPEIAKALGDDDNAYFRFRRRLGQAYAHGYFRSIPPAAGAKLRLHVRFFEVPPGSIAKASIAAFANLLLMFSAAILLAAKRTPVASDFPVLVLTIPAVVSAWLGLDSAGRQLLDGTLSSRLSSMFTLGASLAASVLYMSQVSGIWLFPQDHFNLFGVRDTAWQILVAGALVNCAWTTYLWIGRSVTFYCLADRDVHKAYAGTHGRAPVLSR